MKPILVVALVLACLTAAPLASRQLNPSGQPDTELLARIRELSARLRVRESDPVDRARYMREVQNVTTRLYGEVDRYVATSLNTNQRLEEVEARLRTLLADHR